MNAKTKGELVSIDVCHPLNARTAAAEARRVYPDCSVRTYRRYVQADCVSREVAVVIVRQRVTK